MSQIQGFSQLEIPLPDFDLLAAEDLLDKSRKAQLSDAMDLLRQSAPERAAGIELEDMSKQAAIRGVRDPAYVRSGQGTQDAITHFEMTYPGINGGLAGEEANRRTEIYSDAIRAVNDPKAAREIALKYQDDRGRNEFRYAMADVVGSDEFAPVRPQVSRDYWGNLSEQLRRGSIDVGERLDTFLNSTGSEQYRRQIDLEHDIRKMSETADPATAQGRFGPGLSSAARSVPFTYGGVLAALSGTAAGSAAAGGLLFTATQQIPEAYDDYRRRGLNEKDAARAAMVSGSIEAAIEQLIPFDKLAGLRGLGETSATLRQAVRSTLGHFATTFVGENLEEHAQDITREVVDSLFQKGLTAEAAADLKSKIPGWADLGNRVFDTAVATGALTIPGAAVHGATEILSMPRTPETVMSPEFIKAYAEQHADLVAAMPEKPSQKEFSEAVQANGRKFTAEQRAEFAAAAKQEITNASEVSQAGTAELLGGGYYGARRPDGSYVLDGPSQIKKFRSRESALKAIVDEVRRVEQNADGPTEANWKPAPPEAAAPAPKTENRIVYHGSPFKFDEFDSSKIGSGEGTQFQGWGLYFSSEEGVANWYRDTYSKEKGTEGETYRVSMAAPVEKMLDWDNQPAPEVSKALRKIPVWKQVEEDFYKNPTTIEGEELNSPMRLNGSAIYSMISDLAGGPEQASKMLAAAGIPGIKYYGTEDGNERRNFVVFDPASLRKISSTPGAAAPANATPNVAAATPNVAPEKAPETAPLPASETALPSASPPPPSKQEAEALPEKRPGVWFHGTGSADITRDSLDPLYTRHENLFGHGIYLTDDPSVAASYSRVRAKQGRTSPSIYESEIRPKKVLDAEALLPADVTDILKNAVYESFKEDVSKWASEPGATFEGVFDKLREAVAEDSHQNMIPTSEYVEMFQNIAGDLASAGYDAVTHTGGRRAGKGKKLHNVTIILNPEAVTSWNRFEGKQKQEVSPPIPQAAETESRIDAARGKVEDAWNGLKRFEGRLYSNPLDPEFVSAAWDLVKAYIDLGVVHFQEMMKRVAEKIGTERAERLMPTLQKHWEIAQRNNASLSAPIDGIKGIDQIRSQTAAEIPPRPRPDLALQPNVPAAQTALNDVDAIRPTGPEYSLNEVDQRAQAFVKAEPERAAKMFFDAFATGRPLSPMETRVAVQLQNEAGRMLSSNNPADRTRAVLLASMFRVSGTRAGQSLQSRQAIDGGIPSNMTPGQRRVAAVAQQVAAATASPKDIETLDKAVSAGDQQAAAAAARSQGERGSQVAAKLKDQYGVDLQDTAALATARGFQKAVNAVRAIQQEQNQSEPQNAAWRSTWYQRWLSWGMLSGAITQMRNLTGNVGTLVWENTVMRVAQAAANDTLRVLGRDAAGASTLAELPYVYASALHAVPEALRNFWMTLTTADSAFERQYGGSSLLTDEAGGTAPALPLSEKLWMGPMSLMKAADDVFRTINVTMQAVGVGYRQALAKGLKGADLTRYVNEVVSDPSHPAWIDEHDNPLAFANWATMNMPMDKITNAFVNVRDSHWIFKWLVPFLRFGSAAIRYSNEFLPTGIVGFARAVRNVSKKQTTVADVRRIAAQVLGQSLLWTLYGTIDPDDPWITGATGLVDPKKRDLLRRAGMSPMSIRAFGHTFNYSWLQPAAMVIAPYVDIATAMKSGKKTPQVFGDAFQSVQGQFYDASFMRGMADLFKFAAPDQAGLEGKVEFGLNYLSNFAASFVPAVIRQAASQYRDILPDRRIRLSDDSSMAEAGMELLKTTAQKMEVIPGVKDVDTYDLWGRPRETGMASYAGSLWPWRLISPIQAYRQNVFVGDRILLTYMTKTGKVPSVGQLNRTIELPDKTKRTLTDEQFQTYQKATGQIAAKLVVDYGLSDTMDIELAKEQVGAARTAAAEYIRKTMMPSWTSQKPTPAINVDAAAAQIEKERTIRLLKEVTNDESLMQRIGEARDAFEKRRDDRRKSVTESAELLLRSGIPYSRLESLLFEAGYKSKELNERRINLSQALIQARRKAG